MFGKRLSDSGGRRDLLSSRAAPIRSETMAPAGPPVSKDLKQVLDRLQQHYHDTNSFTAKFNEEIATVGAPKRQRQGTVSFRKPGRMRWEFSDPEKQTIVSDGDDALQLRPGSQPGRRDSAEAGAQIEQRDVVPARNRQYQPRLQGRVRASRNADRPRRSDPRREDGRLQD